MKLVISCQSYSDFKTILDSLSSKTGNVYYHSSTGGFFIVAMSIDFSSSVGIGTNIEPSTFHDDFPNAIELDHAPTVTGATFTVSG